MIHIKLFEGFSTEDFYTPLEADDYYVKVKESIPFTRKDIKYLTYLFYSFYSYFIVISVPRLSTNNSIYDHSTLVSKEDMSVDMFDNVKEIVSYTSPSKKGFSILALGDDYFTINIGSQDGSNKYYLCDQMDGLLKVLKDKEVI